MQAHLPSQQNSSQKMDWMPLAPGGNPRWLVVDQCLQLELWLKLCQDLWRWLKFQEHSRYGVNICFDDQEYFGLKLQASSRGY